MLYFSFSTNFDLALGPMRKLNKSQMLSISIKQGKRIDMENYNIVRYSSRIENSKMSRINYKRSD